MKLRFFRGRPAAALKTLNLARAAGRVAHGFCLVARVAGVANTTVAGQGSWALWRDCGPCGTWPAIHGSWVMGHGSWVMGHGSGQGSWVRVRPRVMGQGQAKGQAKGQVRVRPRVRSGSGSGSGQGSGQGQGQVRGRGSWPRVSVPTIPEQVP
jgi:hypothetical protein